MQNCKDCKFHKYIVIEGHDDKANLVRHEAIDCKNPAHGGDPLVTIDNDCCIYEKQSKPLVLATDHICYECGDSLTVKLSGDPGVSIIIASVKPCETCAKTNRDPAGIRPGKWYHNITNSAHTGLDGGDICFEITNEGEIIGSSGDLIGMVRTK